ncbi:hypothetical protein BLOT_001176 [Blomia tropicalis]|nr:hypothetical protein BLOT_001176 [Blomia tropicalis]
MSQVTRYNLRKDSPETGNSGVATYFSISKCFHAHESQSERLICSQAVSQVKIYYGEAESRY